MTSAVQIEPTNAADLQRCWQPRAHGAALVDQALVSGANFLTTVALTRLLGLDGLGVYALAWMTALFANGLLVAGIVSPMLSIGPKLEHEVSGEYHGAVVVHAAAFSAAIGALLYAGAKVLAWLLPSPAIAGLALPLAVAAAAFQLQDFLRRYFIAHQRVGEALLNDGLSYFGQLAVLAWAFSLPTFTVAQALWIVGATSLIAVAVGLSRIGRLRWSRSAIQAAAQRNWGSGKWLIGSVLVQWCSGNQLFTITAAAVFGPAAAGVMRASQNIAGVMHVLYQGLENVVPAEAARRFSREGTIALHAYLQRISAVAGAAALVANGVIFLGAEIWQRAIYGGQMAGHAFVLRWYAAVYLVLFFGTPLRAYLRTLEDTRPIFWASAASMAFSLAAALPLTRTLGLHGAMLGILLSFVLLTCVLATAAFRRSPIPLPRIAESAA